MCMVVEQIGCFWLFIWSSTPAFKSWICVHAPRLIITWGKLGIAVLKASHGRCGKNDCQWVWTTTLTNGESFPVCPSESACYKVRSVPSPAPKLLSAFTSHMPACVGCWVCTGCACPACACLHLPAKSQEFLDSPAVRHSYVMINWFAASSEQVNAVFLPSRHQYCLLPLMQGMANILCPILL